MGNRGKREFIQVLRLMEEAPQDVVACAVTQAIRLGAIGLDAVKQITLARIERRHGHEPARTKGAAELDLCGVAPAIANAVWHATGKRMRELPITPDKRLMA